MVAIGRIVRTRGNKGELVIGLFPGAPAIEPGQALELRSRKRVQAVVVERVAQSGSEAIVAFRGIATIAAALRHVGSELWSAAVIAPAAGDDLLGFRVFDPRGACWGMVKAQPRYSLNCVLEIEDEETGAVILVPWHESLVVALDRQARTLVIDPPAGLRELNP